MIAALIILAVLNPFGAFVLAVLAIWAARAGILTLRRPTARKPPEVKP